MSRTIKAPALVLKMNPVGEHHRGLTMLVAGEGLLRPLAFGAQGRRSSLRASAVPYNTGTANLHYNGAKDQWRLTAFDPEDCHDGFREDLDRFYTAAAWAEVLLKTYGSGDDSGRLYGLAARGLSLLSRSSSEQIRRLKIGFFWNYLGIEGVMPDVLGCGICSKRLVIGGKKPPARIWPNGLLVCHECAEARGEEIPDGVRRWLHRISSGMDDSVKIGMPPQGIAIAEKWINVLIQTTLDQPLKAAAYTGISPLS